MVLGIVAASTAFIPVLNIASYFLALLAIVFAALWLAEQIPKRTPGRTKSLVAVYTAVGAAVVSLVLLSVVVTVSDPPDEESGSSTTESTEDSGTVTTVEPGLLIEIATEDHGDKTVSLPSVKVPADADHCWGSQSHEFLTDLLTDESITVTAPDDTWDDDVVPALAVEIEQADLGEMTVSAGHGIVSESAASDGDLLLRAQAGAKLQTLGLWGEPCEGDIEALSPEAEERKAKEAEERRKAEEEREREREAEEEREREEEAEKEREREAEEKLKRQEEETEGGSDGGSSNDGESGDGGQDDGSESTAYYENCDAARAAGAAPLSRGDAGYGRHLDRDGDGVACE
ncbi:excalibur calcium-binding domain-containing protein [Salininema proteolyticum]|uniref:Excalibur calcium-binding domain-containing protein n=1 Tax=Salininema proteolyticum TaxID=1607685 RepID=A0ABV8TU16_9ACTN